jgi:peptide/nickel transport system permease protein
VGLFMRGFLIRRLLFILPTLFLVTIIVFLLIRLIPGSVIDIMAAQSIGDVELNVQLVKETLGLDVPIHVQYGRWISNVLHGDLGQSLWTKRAVSQILIERLPVSLELGIMAIITALIIALPIGVYSAIRQDTAGDYISRSFAILCIALPSFWLGTMVVVLPSIWWGWSPSLNYVTFIENPLENLELFIIPAVILGMVLSGTTMRMTRTMMLDVLRQDYVRTALAKGLRERTVVIRHALKNALIPVITIIGLQLPILIGGSVVLEQIFALPGIGRLLIESITKRDYTIVSGINLLMAAFILIVNLTIDLAYAFLDPRVRYH